MLTIFTIPKPFEGHNGIIQVNAIKSWTLLRPACEIILCGDAPGVKETAAEFGVKSLSDIAQNEYGTPLVNSAFTKVANIAKFPILCFVNTDIIFFDSLIKGIQRIPFVKFLVVGRRTNVDITKKLDFNNPKWNSELIELANKSGKIAGSSWIDYFVFIMDARLEVIPPFAVGRPKWDNWFIYNTKKLRIPIIDMTHVNQAIHQNHDYSHVPQRTGKYWTGVEADQNSKLYVESVGVPGHICNIEDASYMLTQRFLLPTIAPSYLQQRWHTYVVLHPSLKPIAFIYNAILKLMVFSFDSMIKLRKGIKNSLTKKTQ
jgi:hypothetical protein